MRFLKHLAPAITAAASAKRGLVFVPNDQWPQDNAIWTQPGSDLTWYYNYGPKPSPCFSAVPQDKFQYVPMMWGVGADPQETTFLSGVRELIQGGRKITHVLSFNEPDGPWEWGGSNIAPAKAAQAWVANFIPLQAQGVKIGLPGCTGAPSGLQWLRQFLGNCSELVSTNGQAKRCPYDFVPLHWYDNFGGLASHIGEYAQEFPGSKIWVTEFAYAHRSLQESEDYYKTSAEYLDRLDCIERYSYFGAFRPQVSNVGPNATLLNSSGQLSKIGSLYLGLPQ